MKMQIGMRGVPASGNGEDGCSVVVPLVCLRPFLLLSFASMPTVCFCFPIAFEMMKELRKWWRRWLDLIWLISGLFFFCRNEGNCCSYAFLSFSSLCIFFCSLSRFVFLSALPCFILPPLLYFSSSFYKALDACPQTSLAFAGC